MLVLQEDEEEARGRLFESKSDIQKAKQSKRNKNTAYSIGQDLAGQSFPLGSCQPGPQWHPCRGCELASHMQSLTGRRFSRRLRFRRRRWMPLAAPWRT